MLVLPMLLLLIMGIIEFGRMMFIFAGVTSASREAARYASGVAEQGGGGPAYYQDCDGIRAAAKRVSQFASPSVTIYYDSDGPQGSSAVEYCRSGVSVDPIYVTLGGQIEIQVTATYQPLVPLVKVPPIPIRAVTKRTILRNVYVK